MNLTTAALLLVFAATSSCGINVDNSKSGTDAKPHARGLELDDGTDIGLGYAHHDDKTIGDLTATIPWYISIDATTTRVAKRNYTDESLQVEADEGDAVAKVELANRLLALAKDVDELTVVKAQAYYLEAASAGNVDAMYFFGIHSLKDSGSEKLWLGDPATGAVSNRQKRVALAFLVVAYNTYNQHGVLSPGLTEFIHDRYEGLRLGEWEEVMQHASEIVAMPQCCHFTK